jgi:hypothetical protein
MGEGSKVCRKCKKTLLLENYCKTKRNQDGLQDWCKICVAFYKSEYKIQHSQRVKDGNRRYYSKNKVRLNKRNKLYSLNNKDKANKRARERRESDPVFKLICYTRSRVWAMAKDFDKPHSVDLVGMSGQEYMSYLESTFWPGMDRCGQGRDGWVIDHIFPLDEFNKSDPEWTKNAFHWSNTQALWYDDNAHKGALIDWNPTGSDHELPERFKREIKSYWYVILVTIPPIRQTVVEEQPQYHPGTA